MEFKTAKYGLWGAVIAAAITGAVALYIHFDEREIKVDKENAVETKQGRNLTSISIKSVSLPPVNTVLESSFYAEFKNESHNEVRDAKATINFGRNAISSCETQPSNVFSKETNHESSIITFDIKRLHQMESIHLYCLLANPTFKNISVIGGNTNSSSTLSYQAYVEKKVDDNQSAFITLFKIVGSLIGVVFLIYFAIILFKILNSFFSKRLE
ncbi:hypothetical protein L2735_08605 [Shewanella olleyana]|uniref:hypothetical protein n=1 Tax=Shewanella olleyana TaxID=135626 RepID=UPI00200BB7AE|nr:hypothetical protein [Shewanella olleyana]MCL1066864.1 hypothetical protein [Shewanella olleyana]